MGKTRPPYPREFKEEAVRLIRESGKSIGQIAKDLGIADQSLRNWVIQGDLDAGRRTDGLTTDERAELRRLRRENRILQEERDILKKVVHADWFGTSERMKVAPRVNPFLHREKRGRGRLVPTSPQKSLTPATDRHHEMWLPRGKHAG